uniref:Fatty acid hydroxylase domain-containing protein n=1 Tax=Eucampia antarctica TaxID=49252 RepID=A0A7S2S2D2_9STRA|mmetsp:Transcript_29994/g.28890  ORF Transcript_29994/g.28890 Transcript_29994/m.28890 type:complete len:329 (+) Transcript_29994:53-1039(+)
MTGNARNLIFALSIFLLCGTSMRYIHASFNTTQDSTTIENNDVYIDILERLWGEKESPQIMDLVFLGCAVLMGLELLNHMVAHSGYWIKTRLIPVRGKHLDDLRPIDKLFITINKAATAPFIYFLFRYLHNEPNVDWSIQNLTVNVFLTKAVLPLVPIFIIYDFFYTILHWFLHIKQIYGYIHKHHHIQKAPSRANVDAVNVHPIEFFLGEYNHILGIYIYCTIFGMKFHVLGAVLFLIIGGCCAGLNHTRFDTVFRIMGITLFDSKYHDVHHRIPRSNYGQYIVLWDHVFGTFRDYDENDRVNPRAQLDMTTGKSLEYAEKTTAKKL